MCGDCCVMIVVGLLWGFCGVLLGVMFCDDFCIILLVVFGGSCFRCTMRTVHDDIVKS